MSQFWTDDVNNDKEEVKKPHKASTITENAAAGSTSRQPMAPSASADANVASALLHLAGSSATVGEVTDLYAGLENRSKHTEKSHESNSDSESLDLSEYFASRASKLRQWLEDQVSVIKSLQNADLDPKEMAALESSSKAFAWMKTSLAVSQAKIQRLRNTESVVERRGLTSALCKELAGQSDELATEAGKFLKLCVDVSESINLTGLKAHNEENTQRINELFYGAKDIDEEKAERKFLRLTPEQKSAKSHKVGEAQALTHPNAVEEAEYLLKRIEPIILRIQQEKRKLDTLHRG